MMHLSRIAHGMGKIVRSEEEDVNPLNLEHLRQCGDRRTCDSYPFSMYVWSALKWFRVTNNVRSHNTVLIPLTFNRDAATDGKRDAQVILESIARIN